MGEKVLTVTKTEEKRVIICDFCDVEMSPDGCCGMPSYYKCDVCGKCLCKNCNHETILESGWGDGRGWCVDLCPNHATKEIIGRVEQFRADRDKAHTEYNDITEKMKKDFYDWMSAKKEG